ncbi:MAG: GNAT family N-acetyltransferase [Pseudomonadota bacterium]
MLEVRYHDSVNVVQGLTEAARSPFERAEWFALLAEAGVAPLVAMASDGDARAALVLSDNGGALGPMANWYSFTWRPAAPDGAEGDALLGAIARGLRQRAHRVTLRSVPEEDGSATRLARLFGDNGWRVEVTQCDTNHTLPVAGRSFAQYWASRPGPLRTTLKRRAKKVETQILTHFNGEAWAQYERIYDASWKPSEGKPAMLRAFAGAEGKAGRLRLGLARREGEPVAAQFWTVEAGTAFIHKLAHLESHRHLSAGTTLSAALFEHVIDTDRVDLVDFGTGNEPYKRDWMEATRPRYQLDCLNLARPRAWIDLARLAGGRLREADVPALAQRPVRS